MEDVCVMPVAKKIKLTVKIPERIQNVCVMPVAKKIKPDQNNVKLIETVKLINTINLNKENNLNKEVNLNQESTLISKEVNLNKESTLVSKEVNDAKALNDFKFCKEINNIVIIKVLPNESFRNAELKFNKKNDLLLYLHTSLLVYVGISILNDKYVVKDCIEQLHTKKICTAFYKDVPLICKVFERKNCMTVNIILELAALKYLDHPNIIKIYDIYFTKNSIYSIMEKFENDLFEIIKYMDFRKIKLYMYQILNGLKYIHSKKIIHRDIKPENIFIRKNDSLVIADFDAAKYESEKNCKQMTTIHYRAPEILLGSENYDYKVDIWSLGCVFAEMLLGRSLFLQKDEQKMLDSIFKLIGTPENIDHPKYARNLSIFEIFDDETKSLLFQMLEFDPTKRISAESALKHEYFKDFVCTVDTSPLKLDLSSFTYKLEFDSDYAKKYIDCIEYNKGEFIPESYIQQIFVYLDELEKYHKLNMKKYYRTYIRKILKADKIYNIKFINTENLWLASLICFALELRVFEYNISLNIDVYQMTEYKFSDFYVLNLELMIFNLLEWNLYEI